MEQQIYVPVTEIQHDWEKGSEGQYGVSQVAHLTSMEQEKKDLLEVLASCSTSNQWSMLDAVARKVSKSTWSYK